MSCRSHLTMIVLCMLLAGVVPNTAKRHHEQKQRGSAGRPRDEVTLTEDARLWTPRGGCGRGGGVNQEQDAEEERAMPRDAAREPGQHVRLGNCGGMAETPKIRGGIANLMRVL